MSVKQKKPPLPNLPWDSYRWNRAIRGAFVKGIVAHQNGQPVEACPYGDKRKPDGRLSRSRSFASAWRDGWRWSAEGKAVWRWSAEGKAVP
jgi:hypothetical protein